MPSRRLFAFALVFVVGLSVGLVLRLTPRRPPPAPESDETMCKIPEHISVWRHPNGPTTDLVPYAWAGDGRQRLIAQKPDDQDVWFVSFDRGRVLLSCTKQ